MSAEHTLKNLNEMGMEEHRSIGGVNAKAVVPYYYDGSGLVPGGGGLIPQGFDYISIPSYNANNDPLTVIYKTGGASGTTVATLNITYDGSGNTASVERT